MPVISVGGAAHKIKDLTGCTVHPQQISNLFYRGHLDNDRCPIVGRARLIPVDYIPEIVAELRRRGLLEVQIPLHPNALPAQTVNSEAQATESDAP